MLRGKSLWPSCLSRCLDSLQWLYYITCKVLPVSHSLVYNSIQLQCHLLVNMTSISQDQKNPPNILIWITGNVKHILLPPNVTHHSETKKKRKKKDTINHTKMAQNLLFNWCHVHPFQFCTIASSFPKHEISPRGLQTMLYFPCFTSLKYYKYVTMYLGFFLQSSQQTNVFIISPQTTAITSYKSTMFWQCSANSRNNFNIIFQNSSLKHFP